jgi:RNA polymerase sigma factor (TIGR02999 family)
VHIPNDSPSAPARATLDQWSARAYDELSDIARRRGESPSDARWMTAPALVHEAYLRLARHALPGGARRAELLGIGARVMRRVLSDHAGERGTLPGARTPHPITGRTLAPTFDDDAAQIGRLEQALRALEERDARLAQVVELRYFGGLTGTEVAEVLGTSGRQAQRDWVRARAQLFDLLRETE